ncbi:hypothetical protein Q669_01905 [Labrenzia sp. C1B10]|nr:hypothetical protein Q669_01905 [Labrenzia sp. C1B10]ERS05552.1 hypothetical protein Q675_04020 [Labrenzia sp. C1B70]
MASDIEMEVRLVIWVCIGAENGGEPFTGSLVYGGQEASALRVARPILFN